MNIRAVLSLGLPPAAPAKPTTPDTAGSFRMTAETSFSSLPTEAKDASSRACSAPKMKPVSCCGMNPLGITI